MTRSARQSARHRRGFLLFEVILSLAVFAAAGVSFAVIFHQMAKSASVTQNELRITRVLESALDETLSLPVLEEGTIDTETASGIRLISKIEILEGLETMEGQLLQDMFRITVTARWYDMGEWKERSVETWRYGRMYQP
jgi:hypothetical protein